MPRWVAAGIAAYRERLPRSMELELIEVKPSSARNAGDQERARAEEGAALLAAVAGRHRVALDERGSALTTRRLAERLSAWRDDGIDTGFLIGGADGLAQEVCQQAEEVWALSALTLPHQMVRVLLAEQLYRAWSLNAGHPYHRE